MFVRLKNATAMELMLASVCASVVCAAVSVLSADASAVLAAAQSDISRMPPSLPLEQRGNTRRLLVASEPDAVVDSVNDTLDKLRAAQPPSWPSPLPSGNQGFSMALEAVTGKPPADDLKQFFSGVVKIERSESGIRIYRQDNQVIEIHPGTEFGDRLLSGIERASQKMSAKFGRPAGDFVAGISSVTLDGNKISVQRTGSSVIPVVVRRQKQDKRYWIKELRLDDISFEICDRKGIETIDHVTGCGAVLDAMSIPVELKEFAQTVNKHGQKVYLIGIQNPLPKAITSVLGLGDVLHLHFAERANKKVETEQDEWEDAERAAGSTVSASPGAPASDDVVPAPAAVPATGAVIPSASPIAAPGAVIPSASPVPAPGAVAPSPSAVPASN